MCENQEPLQCRLCLRNKKSMISIVKQNGHNNCAIKQAIEDLLNFKVSKTDGLPPTICCDCCSKVMGYSAFKAMCLKSKEILWRKAQEKLQLAGCSDTFIESTVLLQKEAGINILAKVGVEDSHALSDINLKREPCEDAGPVIDSDLLLGNTHSPECNGVTNSNRVMNLDESDSLSCASTVVRSDHRSIDEESFHLKLESSSSELSDADKCQDGNLDDLEPSSVKENSKSTPYGQRITECRVILTRCDIDEYKALQEKYHPGKRTMSTCKTSAAQSPKETGSPYSCSDCSITFSSPKFLLKHEQYHHGSYFPPRPQLSVKRTEKWVSIEERSGPRKKSPMNSGRINDITSRKRELIEGECKRSGGKKIYPCKQCPKVFKSPYTLKTHTYIHDGIKPFKCDMCDESFLQKVLKLNHESFHRGEKPFICHVCSKSYRPKGTLKKHLVTHSQLSSYKCKQCRKTFKRSDCLRKHERIHTGECPYKCDNCPKAFTNSRTLSLHNRIHTRVCPYTCPLCGKTFKSSTVLKTHQKIHIKTANPSQSTLSRGH